jgi:hypothetical protein
MSSAGMCGGWTHVTYHSPGTLLVLSFAPIRVCTTFCGTHLCGEAGTAAHMLRHMPHAPSIADMIIRPCETHAGRFTSIVERATAVNSDAHMPAQAQGVGIQLTVSLLSH